METTGMRTRNILKKIERSAQDNPFYTIFVPFAECLPDGFLLGRLARDGDTRATAAGAWRVLLNLAKLDSFWRNHMARIGEIEHAPEIRVRIGLRDLEKG